MLKRKSHISIGIAFYLAYASVASAQITIHLPQANIIARTDFTATLGSGAYSSLVGLVPSIQVRANSSNFANTVGGSAIVPLHLAHIRLRSIGSFSLIGLTSEVTLSTTYGTLYIALASISSGAVIADYRLSTANHTWVSGIYSTPIQWRTGTLWPNQVSPVTPNLVINVPGFIAPQTTIPNVNLLVDNLSFYRNTNGVSTAANMTVSTTVPYLLNVQTTNAQFSFSTNHTYNQLPSTPVNLVRNTLSNVANATPVNLAINHQSLTTPIGIAIPFHNHQTLTPNFEISGHNLQAGFLQAGTYSVPFTYTWSKHASAHPAGNLEAQRSGTLQVVVSDLSEIVANQQAVSLTFANVSHYQQGISTDMPEHIRISKTTPYNVYVRATTANFTDANGEIPVNVLRIGPAEGQVGVNTITLSTVPQLLVNNANPAIDRNLSLRYHIPSNETAKLLGKPAGNYRVDVVYSFTAL